MKGEYYIQRSVEAFIECYWSNTINPLKNNLK
ncbi:hypothetical protein C799_01209 [Bacteroides thetaiotaomicron dnLKV9]|uniref:Uncharacterized protein n=1 Tax=Bacteroides thetaiotaomicron dnLKV9 TaxID=1235785 RepID=R9HDG1_BACT4|nr:hypothetical protein C799_01209 [Bacteroides thetaiotaomicron dnLKV9]